MRIRTLLPLIIALLALALAAACGDDDDGSKPSPSGSATANASVTPTPSTQPLGTAQVLVTPGRELPPADHVGLGVIDPLTFYKEALHGGALTPITCTGLDLDLGVADCTAQGYGTIALDPIPSAAGILECRALLDPDGKFFAVSCSGELTSGPGAFIYSIQS